MTVKYTYRSNKNGFRDPLWCSDLWQFGVTFIGSVCVLAPLWPLLGIAPKWLWCLAVPLLLPFGFQTYERYADRRVNIGNQKAPEGITLHGAEIIGRPCEVSRVFGYARSGRHTGCFRTGLSFEQQRALIIMWGIMLMARLWFDTPLTIVSLIASVSYGTVCLQLFLKRIRYRVDCGSLIIEELAGSAVISRRMVLLAGANVKADFSSGLFRLKKSKGLDLQINLNEMFNPHHFVGAVLGAASAEEPATPFSTAQTATGQ